MLALAGTRHDARIARALLQHASTYVKRLSDTAIDDIVLPPQMLYNLSFVTQAQQRARDALHGSRDVDTLIASAWNEDGWVRRLGKVERHLLATDLGVRVEIPESEAPVDLMADVSTTVQISSPAAGTIRMSDAVPSPLPGYWYVPVWSAHAAHAYALRARCAQTILYLRRLRARVARRRPLTEEDRNHMLHAYVEAKVMATHTTEQGLASDDAARAPPRTARIGGWVVKPIADAAQ